MPHEILFNAEIHERVIRELIPSARELVWIATADIKDMHVGRGRRFVPFLQVLAEKVAEGVQVRLLHAKEPGPRFREDFDRFPDLLNPDLFERALCPRVHSKIVVVDARVAFLGSPNLTGAGLGPKSPHRRNFEAGVLVTDKADVLRAMDHMDEIFLGNHCAACQRRDVCPDPIAP
ncbi:MAG: phospholipase D-like domain-containing protein [Chthoniobacterales bacterium]|jgi:phosphatidylserine/phosphatidylglycerophosphate/cardiolipin synthase-like enzyme